MVLRQDQERIRTLLKDTITLLCRNGLTFSSEFSIEALIGITLDKDDIFLVNINEIVRNEASKVADDKVPGDGNAASSDNESVTSNTSSSRRRRRKRRMRDIKDEPAVSEEESNPAFETQPDLDNSNSQSVTPSTPQHKKSRLNDNSATQLQLKAEPTEDEEDDIVYIKQEMGDSWSEQYQGDEQSHTFTGFSHGADISGMSQDPGSSNMSGVNMWSPGGQGQGYQPRQGNATVTGSFTDPGGQATSPGGTNNQVNQYDAEEEMNPRSDARISNDAFSRRPPVLVPRTTYRILQATSLRGQPKLYDSLGFSYTKNRTTVKCTSWRCSVRNRRVVCPASVYQYDDEFIAGPRPHCHGKPKRSMSKRARKHHQPWFD